MGTPKDSLITRTKIIEAAGRLFTEKGYKGVTVRDIAATAGVHLGALNYHFKSKEALHRDVLLEACAVASITDEEQDYLLTLPPEDALYQIVSESLKRYREGDESQWQWALLSRECRNPGPVFEELAENYFKPQSRFLAAIISGIAGSSAEDKAVQFASISLVGLIETCGLYRQYVETIAPGLLAAGEKDDWFSRRITGMIIQTVL